MKHFLCSIALLGLLVAHPVSAGPGFCRGIAGDPSGQRAQVVLRVGPAGEVSGELHDWIDEDVDGLITSISYINRPGRAAMIGRSAIIAITKISAEKAEVLLEGDAPGEVWRIKSEQTHRISADEFSTQFILPTSDIRLTARLLGSYNWKLTLLDPDGSIILSRKVSSTRSDRTAKFAEARNQAYALARSPQECPL